LKFSKLKALKPIIKTQLLLNSIESLAWMYFLSDILRGNGRKRIIE